MELDKRYAPIAVVDSGVGGISVLIELLRIMPGENYIYFGDSANAPYGTKTHAEVLDIMLENTEKLLALGAKAIVVACNTATGAAVREMRSRYPDVPIVGIEPAIKPALKVCVHPAVLVMATPLTLSEEKFRLLKERFESDGEIIPLPCPGLMEIIESGETSGERVDAYLERLFVDIDKESIDAVVLGCTHYPFIKDAVQKYFGDKVVVLDGGNGTAREARRRIIEAGLENPGDKDTKTEYISTGNDDGMIELCKKLVNEKL